MNESLAVAEKRTRRLRLVVAGVLLLLLVMSGIEIWGLSVGTRDPHGLGFSPSISADNIGQVEPLYYDAGTGDQTISWSPDGHYIAVDGLHSTTVMVIDAWTGRVMREWDVPGYVCYVRWSPDGQRLAVFATKTLHGNGWVFVYSADGAYQAGWQAQTMPYEGAVEWSPDGTMLLSTAQTEIALWRANTWDLIYRVMNASTYGATASWSPDGTMYALGSTPISVYNAATGSMYWEAVLGMNSSSAVAWSPRGDLGAAGAESGALYLFEPNGTLYATVQVDSLVNSYPFGSSVAWSPDGSLVAGAGPGGIQIVSVQTRSVQRTLRFPDVGTASTGPEDRPADMRVAWSPHGNALASTSGYSTESLHVWGAKRSAFALPLTVFGIVWVFGLVSLFWADLLNVFRAPDYVAELWSPADPTLSLGQVLLVFAFASSVMFSTFGLAIGRTIALQAMPSLGWYAINVCVSVVIAALAAAVAVYWFCAIASARLGPQPAERIKNRFFGLVLLPFMVMLGIAAILIGLVLFWPYSPGFDSALAFIICASVPLGIGVALAGRVAEGLPGVERWRAWVGLAISAIFSVVAFYVFFIAFVALLNVFQASAGGELAQYGFSIGFAFGVTSFMAVAIALAAALLGGALAHPLVILFRGYARYHGGEVLELDARKSVLEAIIAKPGIHFRDLLRQSNLGSGTIHYHLSVLEREGFIRARKEGVVKRFYPGRIPAQAVKSESEA